MSNKSPFCELFLADKKKDEFLIEVLRENFSLRARVEILEKDNERLRNDNSELEDKTKDSFTPKTRMIPEEDVTKIKKLRASGLSYRAIELETKWSKFTIGRALEGAYD